ncbi:phosphoribosylformylglycinamidine synthase subunit PurS [Weissella minor]|uniref:Phosphoribosylformylglycinamidine synthase subunit PurS n=1 Tax=Weissella minor TaxID=1620 RepID=A0A0R2JNJ6_9LACO|nr:phosphoribosylformylglycinamidine synthase subunit PurS [Weissella minor]KRN76949.1 hypothetical protein IV67_GL000461 [Weissella minor]
MYLAKIKVTYKPSVLDPQGEVIKSALHRLDYETVEQVVQGKYFEVKLTASDLEDAKQLIESMAEALLINQNTETYDYTVEEVEG